MYMSSSTSRLVGQSSDPPAGTRARSPVMFGVSGDFASRCEAAACSGIRARSQALSRQGRPQPYRADANACVWRCRSCTQWSCALRPARPARISRRQVLVRAGACLRAARHVCRAPGEHVGGLGRKTLLLSCSWFRGGCSPWHTKVSSTAPCHLLCLHHPPCTTHVRTEDDSGPAIKRATYKELESISCNLSAFPNVQFFRVEVCASDSSACLHSCCQSKFCSGMRFVCRSKDMVTYNTRTCN